MRFLAVAALVKDEPDLAEWVAYHLAIGADHIIIGDNASANPVREVLRPFICRGDVSVLEIPTTPDRHRDFYRRIITRTRGEFSWVAAIDADEYLFSVRGLGIRSILEGHQPAGFVVHWSIFGSSGFVRRPRGLVMEAYLLRQAKTSGYLKTIFDPARVVDCLSPHSFQFLPGEAPCNERGEVRYGDGPHEGVGQILRINHYLLKSREDWRTKISRGGTQPNWSRSQRELEEMDAISNVVFDQSILRHRPETCRILYEAKITRNLDSK